MEKIYMENNKSKKRIVNTSVVLSFVVSIFAIISLAMFGIVSNQNTNVSYAAPTEVELPNSFLFTPEDNSVESETEFNVPVYLADNDVEKQVFCVEHNVDPDNDQQYSAGTVIEDYGLLYLLNNTYANGVNRINDEDLTNVEGARRYAETWITQVAIWVYLRTEDSTDNNYLSSADYTKITEAKELNLVVSGNGTLIMSVGENEKIYEKYIKNLVEDAKEASAEARLILLKEKDEITLTEDKEYYQSSLITVTGDPSSALTSYSIVLSGIEGAIVVDEDGHEITNLTGLQPNEKFYIRIPADKVTEEVQKVKIEAEGVFNALTGKYYNAATPNKQKVVSVRTTEKTYDDSIEVEFVKAPDTGMNTAQTIYFIGLIVLLCGVGIVYANAKPVQVK